MSIIEELRVLSEDARREGILEKDVSKKVLWHRVSIRLAQAADMIEFERENKHGPERSDP